MDENTNIPQNDEAFVIPGKKEKKSKLPVVAALLFVLCVVLTAAAVYIFRPENKVKRELLNDFSDYFGRESVLKTAFDENVVNAFLKNEYDMQGSLELENNNIYDKVNGIGVSFNTVMSNERKKASSNSSIDYVGMNLAAFQTYMDEEKTSVYVPSLFNESFTLENDNVISQLKTLPLVGAKFANYPEFSFKPFALADMVSVCPPMKDKVKTASAFVGGNLLGQLKYTKNGKITAADGNEYDSYIITIPADAAKYAYATLLKEVRNSGEYTSFMDKQAELIYAVNPKATETFGEKEAFRAQLDADCDKWISDVENSTTGDINIIATPVENGMTFDIDHTIDGKTLKMSGEYDRYLHDLKLKGTYTNGEESFDFDYYDHAAKHEGEIIIEERKLELKRDGEMATFYSNVEYRVPSSGLSAVMTVNDGGEEFKILIDGKMSNDSGSLKIEGEKLIQAEYGDYQAEFGGHITTGARTSEPQDVNAPEDVKIKDIDFKKAMEIYREAKSKLDGLKKFSSLF